MISTSVPTSPRDIRRVDSEYLVGLNWKIGRSYELGSRFECDVRIPCLAVFKVSTPLEMTRYGSGDETVFTVTPAESVEDWLDAVVFGLFPDGSKPGNLPKNWTSIASSPPSFIGLEGELLPVHLGYLPKGREKFCRDLWRLYSVMPTQVPDAVHDFLCPGRDFHYAEEDDLERASSTQRAGFSSLDATRIVKENVIHLLSERFGDRFTLEGLL